MNDNISNNLFKLKVGSKIRINGEIYTVKEKLFNKAKDRFHSDNVYYKLDDNYVLEYDWDWRFFKIVAKKGFLLKTISSDYIEIKDIKIIKK